MTRLKVAPKLEKRKPIEQADTVLRLMMATAKLKRAQLSVS